MDQSKSLQDQEEIWLAKLAMLGCTVDTFDDYYFIYLDGRLKICGHDLASMTLQMATNLEKGLYQ